MGRRGRNRNPRIIPRTLPPITEPAVQTTERPTEKATDAVITKKPTVATTLKATEEVATQADNATETQTEAAPEATQPPTEPLASTQPKAVEASTKMIDPLTRPTSVHRFFKQSAFVSSTKDERTCADVNGVCRQDSCLHPTEYLKGRFQCGAGFIGCCVPR